VGSIFRGRWCVMSTCLCLPQLRELERSVRTAVQRIWDCSPADVAGDLPRSISSRVLAI
jgi:hypothetical protein